ncbi:hypothetical protein JTB14_003790 [Gonioctena quinquepunctata]|nr:hypothetical protein JTB14_003790 [Gonioctena quinquepunctata]
MFKTVIPLAIWFIAFTNAANRDCDSLGVLVYEDMNCEPVFEGSNKCPSNYKCPQLWDTTGDVCYFRNKTYKQGEWVDGNDTFCQTGCSCIGRKHSKSFRCAIGECGQFGPPLPEGCYWKYSLKSCCGSSYCPTEPVHKCTYENVEYKEGERFFPSKSCSMCLCQKGFKGKIEEPYCIPRQCEGQIRYQNEIKKFCAPVYSREEDLRNGILCCPNKYVCPGGDEIITGSPTGSGQCEYGSKTLKVGQEFKKEVDRRKYSCKCRVPPLVTCVLEQ